MTTPRRALPDRRASETFSFFWRGMCFTATISRYDDGNLAEIFLSNGKVNSHADTAARDSAVVASLALQHGTPLDTIRQALLRDAQGHTPSPLGTALDLLEQHRSRPCRLHDRLGSAP